MEGKTSNEVTVSTGCVDGGQLINLKVLYHSGSMPAKSCINSKLKDA